MGTAKKARIAILIILIVCAAFFMTLKICGRIGISEDEIMHLYYEDKAKEYWGEDRAQLGQATPSNEVVSALYVGLVFLRDRTEGEYFIYCKPEGLYFGWHLLGEGKITKKDKIKKIDCGDFGTAFVSLNYDDFIASAKYYDGRARKLENIGKVNEYDCNGIVIVDSTFEPIEFYDRKGNIIETDECDYLEFNSEHDLSGVLIFEAFGLLAAAAVIRSLIKVKRGKKIDITPVGVYNDLPSSVTGINKHKKI